MSIEKNLCPRRESLLQRLLAENSPGTLPPEDQAHLRECAACARTVRAAQKMAGMLDGHFGEIKTSLQPVPPGPALQQEMQPASPLTLKIPLVIGTGILLLLLAAAILFRSPASSLQPTLIPTPVPSSPPLVPQLMLVSGRLLNEDGIALPVGKPSRSMGQLLRCPTEAVVRLDADVFLHMEQSESRLNLEKVDLASGRIDVEVSRKGRPFRVVTPAATISVIGTKFNVALEKSGQTAIAVTEGVVRVETMAGVKQLMNPGDKLRIDHRGKIIPVPTPVSPASASEPVMATPEPASATAVEPSELPVVQRNWQFLIDASARGQLETVKRALANGATVNIQDEEGNTPLHQAARNSQKTVVELLLKNGANKQIKNKWGETALDLAIKQKASEIEPLLR